MLQKTEDLLNVTLTGMCLKEKYVRFQDHMTENLKMTKNYYIMLEYPLFHFVIILNSQKIHKSCTVPIYH